MTKAPFNNSSIPTTAFNALTLLLFSGPLTLEIHGRGIIVDDGWLRLRGWARIGVLIGRLRLMLDAVLAAKVDDPWASLDERGEEIVRAVRHLVEFDGMDR